MDGPAIRLTVHNLATLLLLAILCEGCATANLSEVTVIPASQSKVSIAVADHTARRLTPEQLDTLKAFINERLLAGGSGTVSATDKGVPCMTGDVTLYDPGDRSLRYWLGFLGIPAGKGTLVTCWHLTDTDGKVLGCCKATGTIGWGILGGDFGEVMEKTGDQLVLFLKVKKE